MQLVLHHHELEAVRSALCKYMTTVMMIVTKRYEETND